MPAKVIDRTYSAGTPYSIVVCGECGIVLNSGHHYPENMRVHARALASEHNRERHNG